MIAIRYPLVPCILSWANYSSVCHGIAFFFPKGCGVIPASRMNPGFFHFVRGATAVLRRGVVGFNACWRMLR